MVDEDDILLSCRNRLRTVLQQTDLRWHTVLLVHARACVAILNNYMQGVFNSTDAMKQIDALRNQDINLPVEDIKIILAHANPVKGILNDLFLSQVYTEINKKRAKAGERPSRFLANVRNKISGNEAVRKLQDILAETQVPITWMDTIVDHAKTASRILTYYIRNEVGFISCKFRLYESVLIRTGDGTDRMIRENRLRFFKTQTADVALGAILANAEAIRDVLCMVSDELYFPPNIEDSRIAANLLCQFLKNKIAWAFQIVENPATFKQILSDYMVTKDKEVCSNALLRTAIPKEVVPLVMQSAEYIREILLCFLAVKEVNKEEPKVTKNIMQYPEHWVVESGLAPDLYKAREYIARQWITFDGRMVYNGVKVMRPTEIWLDKQWSEYPGIM